MQPAVSLIIPVFRVESTIERCAHSLLRQTYSNIEYIFVDDASDDKSIELLKCILEKYPERQPFCKIIRHDYNKGLTMARDTGLSCASGNYVWHIDSDDEIANDAVEILLKTAVRNNADIVLFNAVEIFDSERRIIKNVQPDSIESETCLTLIRKKRFELCFRLIRRSLYDGLVINSSISMGEDWATTPRLSSKAKVISYIDKECYYYYRNGSSMTATIGLKAVKSLLLAYEVLSEFFLDTKYAKYLPTARAFLKVHLLKISRFSNDSFNYIFYNIFKGVQCNSHDMSFPNRFILTLTNANKLWLAKSYIRLSCKIAELMH